MAPKVGSVGGIALGMVAKEAVGETIEGGFRVAAATITSVGTMVGGALQGAGSALGGALQGALTPAPTTIVNNIGIAGQAGKTKITGVGSLPAPKKSAKPVVNEKMPTEKLLHIAVKYLSSIDKTLQDQINFERLAVQKQAQAEREAAIESKPDAFSKLGDKFGASQKLTEKAAGDQNSLASKLIKATALGTLGVGALAALNTDTQKLSELKQNWSEFLQKFWWLDEFLVMAGGAATGARIGGLQGALVGALAAPIAHYIFGQTYIGKQILESTGLSAPSDAVGGPASSPGKGDVALAAGAVGYGIYRGAKTANDIRSRMSKMRDIRSAPRADPSLRGSGFRDPITGRAASRRAVAEGGGWLSGAKGQKFIRFLQRRFGKTWLSKVIKFLAKVFVGVEITATGAGAIPGILWTLVTIGLDIALVVDLVKAYYDFEEEEKLKKDATVVNNTKKSDAAPAAGTAVSSNATRTSLDPNEALPPATTGPIDAILDKNPEQLSDSELRQLVEAQGRIEDPSGVTNNPGGILYQTGPLQEHQIGFKPANADSSVRIAVYDTPENGIRAAMMNWRNSRYYKGKSIREGLGIWSGGNGAHYAKMLGSSRPGYEGTLNPTAETGAGNLGSGIADLASQGMKSFGKFVKSIGSEFMTKGTYYSMADQTADNAKNIAESSRSLESTLAFGSNKNKQDLSSLSSMNTSLMNASGNGKLELIDPNRPDGADIIKYLQYHRLATPKMAMV